MSFVPPLTHLTLRSLLQVQTCLSEEEARVHQLLPSQTLASIRATLENVFLTPHWQTLMDMASPGLNAMVHHDKLDDLSLQFSLAPVEVLFICRFLKTSIQKRGTELNRTSMEGRELVDSDSHVGTDTPTQGHASAKARARNVSSRGLTLPVALGWVEGVLQLKDKFDRIWEVSFKKDPKIEVALHEVLTIVSFIVIHVKLINSGVRIVRKHTSTSFRIHIPLYRRQSEARFERGTLHHGFPWHCLMGVPRKQTSKSRSSYIKPSACSDSSQRRTYSNDIIGLTWPSASFTINLPTMMPKETCSPSSKSNVVPNSRPSSKSCSTTWNCLRTPCRYTAITSAGPLCVFSLCHPD